MADSPVGGRRPIPDERPVALTVAGSDSGGGAGVLADGKAMAAQGVTPTTAITAVTAQHTRGVERSTALSPADVRAQIRAVADDYRVAAVKTGMLANAEVVAAVADALAGLDAPLVVDPVVVATSGDRLLTEAGVDAYDDLLAEATLATPNRAEATLLTGVDAAGSDSVVEAADAVRAQGADAALVTGGDAGVDGDSGDDAAGRVVDVLATADGVRRFSHPRVDTQATHGTGCTLSATIAARLARGDDVETAVESATATLERALHHPLAAGERGCVNHLAGLRNEAARSRTADEVRETVEKLRSLPVGPLLPEVGSNVVGATPYAESPADVAAVDGRITRTVDGVRAGEVRFGASSHVARFLLAAREFAPEYRFAANVRYEDAVADALDAAGWPVAAFDREAEPEDADTMPWSARETVAGADPPPVAVVDDGAVGQEPMTRLLAADGDELLGRLRALAVLVAD